MESVNNGQGSGPLPGGQDITVVQTPDRTIFIDRRPDPMAQESRLTQGAKYDNGKCRLDLLPFDALWETGKVYTMGAQKYADWNWQLGLKYSRVIAALFRHLLAWIMGETYDRKDGQHHLSSVVWCGLTLLHYDLNKQKFLAWDDRRLGTWALGVLNEDPQQAGSPMPEMQSLAVTDSQV